MNEAFVASHSCTESINSALKNTNKKRRGFPSLFICVKCSFQKYICQADFELYLNVQKSYKVQECDASGAQ